MVSEEFKEFIKSRGYYIERYYAAQPKIDLQNSKELYSLLGKLKDKEEFQEVSFITKTFGYIEKILNPEEET